MTNSIISGNSAGDGGGMGSDLQGTTIATVSDSTISGNSAGRGGGIFNYPQTLTVISSTVSGNSASDGGGIWNGGNPGSVTVINSTISGNSATASGGGISNYAQNNGLTLKNSTLSGNSAPAGNGSAIFNQGGSTTTIGDTVLNAGASGGTLFNNGGTVTSLGYNLASDTGGGVLTGPGDQINTDPMLGPLQDNGGPTFTHELLPGSPAIDMGDPSFTPPPDYDQRGPGFPRVVDGRIDIGSFEVQAPAAPTNLTATVTACQEITLHWTDNSNNETGFKIERSNNGVNFSQIARVPANTTMYVNHLATSGLRYYRVRAYIHVSGGDYNSGYSNIDHATADPCPTPSPTPTHTDSYIHANAYSYVYPDADADGNSDGYVHGYTNCDANGDCDIDAYADSDRYGYTNTHPHSHGYSNANRSCYSNGNGDGNTYSYGDTHAGNRVRFHTGLLEKPCGMASEPIAARQPQL